MIGMRKLSWARAAAWRSARHHLDRRAPAGSMVAVASRLCGLHAQVMSSAELTVWARVEEQTREQVQRALWEERTLVKTWAMRGTLHLLPAVELPLWRAALGIHPHFLGPAVWRRFGLSLDDLDRLTEAVGSALTGRIMTREELVREVRRLGGLKARTAKLALSGWGTMLRPAAFTGRLCFAPSEGQRVRFTHPSTWLMATDETVDAETAAAAVTRRYLAAYGPAADKDLARWWGAGGVSTARRWIAALGDEACTVEVAGETAWMLAADARAARDRAPARSVRLLPIFDQYVVAATLHADHLLPGNWRARIYRPQGWISPVLLVNGRMEGTWKHAIRGSRVDVTIEPFADPPAWVRRAAEEEAERLATFLGGSLRLAWRC